MSKEQQDVTSGKGSLADEESEGVKEELEQEEDQEDEEAAAGPDRLKEGALALTTSYEVPQDTCSGLDIQLPWLPAAQERQEHAVEARMHQLHTGGFCCIEEDGVSSRT